MSSRADAATGLRRWDAQQPRGIVHAANSNQWIDVALTLKPNVLLETDRASYGDAIHQFPRKGGLRECIRARAGHYLGSCDYEGGELVTHGQNLIWIVGESRLAQALLRGIKPHNALGATMMGISYEEFSRRIDLKDPQCKDFRQLAKIANFGLPGGMGPVKLVLSSRKPGSSNPDTPCPGGPAILDDKGTRGYRGVRFCVLMDRAERCGVVKVTEWKGQTNPPTCRRCIECAERLREHWHRQWPEMKRYFKYVTDATKNGQLFKDGTRLAPGEVVLHVSRIIRGGVGFTDGANGWFQALLARASKLAERRAQRECVDRTVVVSDEPFAPGRTSEFAGGPSPLLGNRIVMFAHDELIPEVRIPIAHEAMVRTSEIMVGALAETCPDMAGSGTPEDPGAIRAEPCLMPRWYKSAEAVYHYGRLEPWTPEHDSKKCADCIASRAAA